MPRPATSPIVCAVSTDRSRASRRATSGCSTCSCRTTKAATRPEEDPGDQDEPQQRPGRRLRQREQQPGDAGPEQDRPDDVERRVRPVPGRGDHEEGREQGEGADDGAGPERQPERRHLRQHAGQRVAEADARHRGHGQDRDRRAGALALQRVAGGAHGQRGQPEADPHEAAADEQPAEAQRQGGQRAAGGDDREGDQDDLAASGAVTEAPHGGGRDGADQEAERQGPLRGRDRHPGLGRDGRDQRGSQAADHGHHQAEVDQDGDQRAVPRCHHVMTVRLLPSLGAPA